MTQEEKLLLIKDLSARLPYAVTVEHTSGFRGTLHDINFDDDTSWECTIYIDFAAIYTVGKRLSYQDALLLGIKEAIKFMKTHKKE